MKNEKGFLSFLMVFGGEVMSFYIKNILTKICIKTLKENECSLC